MSPVALLTLAAIAFVVGVVVLLVRRRGRGRRAHGPRGLGESLARGRAKLRPPSDPN